MGRKVQSVRLENLVKRYGDTIALNRFCLDIRGQEFVTLLGPSGCGKSTALNCVAGLITLDEGAIYVDGRQVQHLPPERRDLGMVFQNYALFPHLTVRRNIAFGLEVRGVKSGEIEGRVASVLELTQLGQLRERYPLQLSGGQQQRVALARALVVEPSILLMDEPLSNLDTSLRATLRTEIKRLHRALGLTSIYVTHDQSEALALSDRIVVMRAGVIQQVGVPEEVFNRPANKFVADFMGFKNFIEMDAVTVDGILLAREAELTLSAGYHQGIAPGQRVIMAMRPEALRLGAGDAHLNRMRGCVELVEYLGTETNAEVRLPGGQLLQIRSLERLTENQNVELHIDPAEVAAFPVQA